METNTANENSNVYCLMYTCQQESAFICGILDPYVTAPRARHALQCYVQNLIADDYVLITKQTNECKLFRKIDSQEFHLYIEERKLL